MKYAFTFMALLCLAACGVSSNAGKLEAPKIDLAAELPVLSGENLWKMDSSESELTFTATHQGREFTGNFSHFSAAIQLDPLKPETGRIHAVIDLSSADAEDRDRNKNLPGKDWFFIDSFPTATFKSDDISALGGDNYQAKGKLSLKGVSKPVILMFSLQVDGTSAVAIGGTDLNRVDYNIGEGPDFVGEDWVNFAVGVKFRIKANQ